MDDVHRAAGRPKAMKRALLLVNPRSGRGDGLRLAQGLVPVFREGGWRVWPVTTPSPQAMTWLARFAVRARVDAVLVLAGDGSLRWAARGLLHSPVPLGLLPNGTGNVLARYLGLPIPGPWNRLQTLRRAARRLMQAKPRPWDMLRVNRHWAVLWVGWGLDAALVHRIERHRPRHGGRAIAWTWLRFIGSALGSLGRWKPQPIRGRPSLPLVAPVWMVVFASLPWYAGGVLRFPQGAVGDGRLEAWPLVGAGPARLVGQMLRAFPRMLGWPLRWPFPGVSFTQGVWKAPGPWPLHADGDPLPPARRVHVQVRPQALSMLMPEPALR